MRPYDDVIYTNKRKAEAMAQYYSRGENRKVVVVKTTGYALIRKTSRKS